VTGASRRGRRALARAFCAALVLSGAGMSALAADPPPERTGPQPGRLSDLEEQLRRSGAPRLGQEPGQVDRLRLEESARPRPESQVTGPRFVLQTLSILGNTVIPEAAIADQVREFVGQSVTAADLQEMAARITRLYAQRGFVTSRCVVPAQRVEGGAVTLQIEEDRLGAVQLAGATSYRFDMKVFLDQLNDLRGKIINSQELEGRLRLVARIPGARVTPALRKSAFGVTDLVLELADLEDVGSISVANDGSELTSRNRLSVSKTVNNVTGSGDVLNVAATLALPSTQYFGGFTGTYQAPLGRRGGRLTVNASGLFYRLDPARVGNNAIRYEGGSRALDASYEQPLSSLRPALGNAAWFAGVEHRSVKAATVYNTIFDKPAGYRYVDGQDELLVVTGGLRYEYLDDWWGQRGRSTAALSFKRALAGWFGAMDQDDISNKRENLLAGIEPVVGPIGDVRGMRPDFLKVYLGLGRVQSLPSSLVLLATLESEWANADRVPQSYEFSGADNGVSGVRAGVQLRRPLGETGLQLGVGYNWARAVSYYRDAAGGGAPACQTAPGVYEARFVGRNTCTSGVPFVTMSYRYKRFFGEVTLSDPSYFGANQQKVRVTVGSTW
jgi:hemolysin activation/secretion protein